MQLKKCVVPMLLGGALLWGAGKGADALFDDSKDYTSTDLKQNTTNELEFLNGPDTAQSVALVTDEAGHAQTAIVHLTDPGKYEINVCAEPGPSYFSNHYLAKESFTVPAEGRTVELKLKGYPERVERIEVNVKKNIGLLEDTFLDSVGMTGTATFHTQKL